MNIRIYILIVYNIVRVLFNKLLHGNRWQVHYLQRISPDVRLKIYAKGLLRIGRNANVESGCDIQVHGSGTISIGDGTYMNRYCMLSAHDRIEIGCNCMFGPGVKVFDNNHKFSRDKGVSTELTHAPIVIGNNCWLASNVVILKGATIGNNCVIGAGCVISGNVPDSSIVRSKGDISIEPVV